METPLSEAETICILRIFDAELAEVGTSPRAVASSEYYSRVLSTVFKSLMCSLWPVLKCSLLFPFAGRTGQAFFGSSYNSTELGRFF